MSDYAHDLAKAFEEKVFILGKIACQEGDLK